MAPCKYCDKEAHFALYELKKDGTKKWVEVCDFHDQLIAANNKYLGENNKKELVK